jgi:hypothetical protein
MGLSCTTIIALSAMAILQVGSIPNLGYSRIEVIQQLEAYVLNRALAGKGMPDFSGRLIVRDVEKLKAFIQITVDASIQ